MYKGEDRKIISPPVMSMSRIDLRLLSVTFIKESVAQRTLENLSLIIRNRLLEFIGKFVFTASKMLSKFGNYRWLY